MSKSKTKVRLNDNQILTIFKAFNIAHDEGRPTQFQCESPVEAKLVLEQCKHARNIAVPKLKVLYHKLTIQLVEGNKVDIRLKNSTGTGENYEPGTGTGTETQVGRSVRMGSAE